MIERIILVYAARAVSVILIVVETTQAIRKIREALNDASRR